MKEVSLRLNEEQKRVILHGLKMYKQSVVTTLNKNAFQKEIANHELQIVDQAFTKLNGAKVSRCALPTIAPQKAVKTSNKVDWEHIFSEMKSDDVGAVCVIGKAGENIQVSYERDDQVYALTLNGQLIMQNQNLGSIIRQFQMMYIKEM